MPDRPEPRKPWLPALDKILCQLMRTNVAGAIVETEPIPHKKVVSLVGTVDGWAFTTQPFKLGGVVIHVWPVS